MFETVDGVFEDRMLRPLVALPIKDHQRVRMTIETNSQNDPLDCDEPSDPLAGKRVDTGIADLAEDIDDKPVTGNTSKLAS